jgi:hypothetical protein
MTTITIKPDEATHKCEARLRVPDTCDDWTANAPWWVCCHSA